MVGLPTIVQWVTRMTRAAGGRTTGRTTGENTAAITATLGGQEHQQEENSGCATFARLATHLRSGSFFCEAKWDWLEGCDSDSIRASDHDNWADWQIRQVDDVMDLDEKQEELEEQTRLEASFKVTCVRSTECYKLAH